MLQNIHSILIGITEEGDPEERSSALAYGLSLAREASAHVTVQAASLKLTLTHAFITVGTGYGMEQDWRHGMYQGPLVVQGLEYAHDEIAPIGQYGVVDHVARFTYDGHVGDGLHEHGFFGPFRKYGMTDGASGASS